MIFVEDLFPSQVCAVALSSDASYLFTGGLDNVATNDVIFCDASTLDSVTLANVICSLSISPDGNHLLSNAMDSSL
eukprot:gene45033-56056_t